MDLEKRLKKDLCKFKFVCTSQWEIENRLAPVTHCDALQRTATHCNTPQSVPGVHGAIYRNDIKEVSPPPASVCCSMLQCGAGCCSEWQCVASIATISNRPPPLPCLTHCNTPQTPASHCNILHHTTISKSLPPSRVSTVVQYVAVRCSEVQGVAVCCSEL